MSKFIVIIFLMCQFSASYGQDFNKVVFDERAQKEVIKGYCNAEGLKTTVWTEIFEGIFNAYQPDMDVIMKLIPMLKDVEIVVTLGTWCGDSKEHVPAFLKILSLSDYDFSGLTLIGLDSNFDSGDSGVRPYETEKVPTFIFFLEGEEMGRIIETPEGTLENHMSLIFGL